MELLQRDQITLLLVDIGWEERTGVKPAYILSHMIFKIFAKGLEIIVMEWLSLLHLDIIRLTPCLETSIFESEKIQNFTLMALAGELEEYASILLPLVIIFKILTKLYFRFASTIIRLDFFDTVSVEKRAGTMGEWCGSDCNYFELFKINWTEMYFQ